MDHPPARDERTQPHGIPDGRYAVPAPEPRAILAATRRWVPIVEFHLRVMRRVWRGMVYSRLGTLLLSLLAVRWGVGLLVDRG
ncbi:MAG TPA: hypothetical protein PLJ48_00520, partial [Dermatophilaceae bacterium]|nr:hypothetical protein [Dermatophilaceae bacterium]